LRAVADAENNFHFPNKKEETSSAYWNAMPAGRLVHFMGQVLDALSIGWTYHRRSQFVL